MCETICEENGNSFKKHIAEWFEWHVTLQGAVCN